MIKVIIVLYLTYHSDQNLRKEDEIRLVYDLYTNNLLNFFQSAYIKHHSTETDLHSVHDHIIKAMSHQQVTCLTILDLSSAFDTYR